jgi:hypothetical protein
MNLVTACLSLLVNACFLIIIYSEQLSQQGRKIKFALQVQVKHTFFEFWSVAKNI